MKTVQHKGPMAGGDRLYFLFDAIPIRLGLGALVLLGMLAGWFLRGRLADHPLMVGMAGLLLAGYGCLLWPGGRRAGWTWAERLSARWQAIPAGWRVGGCVLLLLALFVANLRYLANLPFVLDADQYRSSANGQFTVVAKGHSKDTTIQLALNGLQQGCLLCGAYTPDAPAQPLENLVFAEDLGMVFFFGLTVRAGLLPPTVTGLHTFVILGILLGVAIAGLIVGLIYRSLVTALLFVGAIFSVGLLTPLPAHTVDVLVRGYGIPAWVMMVVAVCGVAILTQFEQHTSAPRNWLVYGCTILLGLVTGFGFLTRSEAGYIALLYAMGLLAHIAFWKKRWAVGLMVGMALIISAALPLVAFQTTIDARTAWYNLPPIKPDSFPSHGIWHNAYIGLGYVSNRWGIVWDDAYGWQVVQQKCPGVGYVTPQYFSCLRTEFFNVVQADPTLLPRNLAVKTVMMLVILLLTPAALWASLAVVLARPQPTQISLLLLGLFNLLPGLLAIPDRRYSLGFFMAVVCLGVIVLVEFGQKLALAASPDSAKARA